MSSKIKVDTIENVAGSGNVSLGSGHNLVVPGTVSITGESTLTGGAKVNTIKHSGGTTAMTIDSSGRVLQPSVPAFRVGLTSDQSITNANTNTTVEWNEGTSSESDNCFTQGGFSWSSGVLTIPVAGVYSFSILLRLDSIGSGNCNAKIIKNNEVTGNKEFVSLEGAPASNFQAVTGSGIFKCSANDTIKVTVYAESDSSWSVDEGTSHFSGHLIG